MLAFSFRSCLRFVALGALGLAAAACTSAGDGPSVSLEQSVPSPNTRMTALAPNRDRVGPTQAMATLPGETIASVRYHAYTNGSRQDILLKGGAIRGVENSITVLARTSRTETLDERVPLFKPTEDAIRAEIGGQFQHLTMQVAERESSNAYGSYGLALGRGGDDVRCAYMWQWIDENRLPADTRVTGPVSIRVHLCKAGTTFDAMAAELDHLTFGGAASLPRLASNQPAMIVEGPAKVREPVRLHHSPARRIAMTRKPHPFVARQEAPILAPIAADAGPRYMSPVAVGTPSPAVAIATGVPAQLSGDLPAQAYLGPAANPATMKTAATKYY